MDIDNGNHQRNEHDGCERHALFHLHVFEAVERHIGDHGETRIQREGKHDPRDLRPAKPRILTLPHPY